MIECLTVLVSSSHMNPVQRFNYIYCLTCVTQWILILEFKLAATLTSFVIAKQPLRYECYKFWNQSACGVFQLQMSSSMIEQKLFCIVKLVSQGIIILTCQYVNLVSQHVHLLFRHVKMLAQQLKKCSLTISTCWVSTCQNTNLAIEIKILFYAIKKKSI